MDKWQKREAQRHAAENDVTFEEAAAELFPDEVAAPRRRTGSAGKAPAKQEAPGDKGAQ